MSCGSRRTREDDFKGLPGGKGAVFCPEPQPPTSLQLLLGYWPTLKHNIQFSLKCQCCFCGHGAALDHHLLEGADWQAQEGYLA